MLHLASTIKIIYIIYKEIKTKEIPTLAREKRAQIEILLKQGLAKTKIAKAVGISRSTINDFQKVLSSNLLRSNFLEFFKVLSPIIQNKPFV